VVIFNSTTVDKFDGSKADSTSTVIQRCQTLGPTLQLLGQTAIELLCNGATQCAVWVETPLYGHHRFCTSPQHYRMWKSNQLMILTRLSEPTHKASYGWIV